MNQHLAKHSAACLAAVESFEHFGRKIAAARDSFELHKLITELEAFARFHARSEEAVMVECGYESADPDDFALHRAEHFRLSTGLDGVQRLFAEGGCDLGEAVSVFVGNWVALHRLSSQRLIRFCDGGAEGRAAAECRLQLAA